MRHGGRGRVGLRPYGSHRAGAPLGVGLTLLLAGASLLLCVLAGRADAAAHAGVVATAVAHLRSAPPVYLDPSAPAAAGLDLAAVRAAAHQSAGDVDVAVLPAGAAAEVGGDPAALPGALAAALGRGGTVVVLAGSTFEASSTTLGPDRVAMALADATTLLRPGVPGGATGAVTSLLRELDPAHRDAAASAGDVATPGAARRGSSSGLVGLGLLAVLLVAAAVLVPRALRRPSRRVPAASGQERPVVHVDAHGRLVPGPPSGAGRSGR